MSRVGVPAAQNASVSKFTPEKVIAAGVAVTSVWFVARTLCAACATYVVTTGTLSGGDILPAASMTETNTFAAWPATAA